MNNIDFNTIPERIGLLQDANIKLGLDKIEEKMGHNNVIFVYTMPKVGSTSLVSSLIIFSLNNYVIIHIHDEIMLKNIYGVENVSISEIISFNSYLNRNVTVIDIYRSPIEHKISEFFEKVAVYHFNTTPENINKYDTDKLINRFNSIFPYLVDGDIFMDVYKINDLIQEFDFNSNYIFLEQNRIKYLKLRLKDVNSWKYTISKILGIDCVIVNDYSTNNKNVSIAFNKFKEKYRIPENLLSDFIENNNKYLSFYYSKEEKEEYINMWKSKSCCPFPYMDVSNYNLYVKISNENQKCDIIDYNHYLYNGCKCQGCIIKRNIIINKLIKGETNYTRVIHEEASNELKDIKNTKKYNQVCEYNKRVALSLIKPSVKKFGKDPSKIMFKK